MNNRWISVTREAGASGISRRRAASALLIGVPSLLGAVGCGLTRRAIAAREMAEAAHLAVVGGSTRFADGGIHGALVPQAIAITAENAGSLPVDTMYSYSVSPDAEWVVWVPLSAQMPPTLEPLVVFSGIPWSPRRVRYQGRYGTRLALSSSARHIAILTFLDPLNRRLIMLDPKSGAVDRDLSGLITGFSLLQCECLRISGNGARLAVGTRKSLVVIDLPSTKSMFESEGRFPSLSPNGDSVAFVDGSGALTVVDLEKPGRKALSNRWWTASGVSSWSPDGKFILAGINETPSIFTNLAAIQVPTGEIFDIMRLNEGDLGGGYFWIKRNLLTLDVADNKVEGTFRVSQGALGAVRQSPDRGSSGAAED